MFTLDLQDLTKYKYFKDITPLFYLVLDFISIKYNEKLVRSDL